MRHNAVVLLAFATTVMPSSIDLDACDVCECKSHQHIVDCTSRGLRELPRGIPKDTLLLDLGENFLQEIPYDALLEFKSLVTLNITGNMIEKPFEMPVSVRRLEARGNRFQDIKPMMRNCINLELVIFKDNNIRILETDTFRRCTNVSTLMLEGNNMSEIQPGGLAGPQNIENLELEWNAFGELGPSNMEGLQCTRIGLTHNDLRVVRPYTFGRIANLYILTLSHNKVEEIPTGLFLDPSGGVSHKEPIALSVANNGLRFISPGAFYGAKNFESVYLDTNELTSLPSNMFGESTEITIMELSRNKLVSSGMPDDVFHNTTITASLDIASNRLTVIPDGLFRGQRKLRNLYLQRNQIRVLQKNVFDGLWSLQELMIFENPITEIADWLFYETKLTSLHMFQTKLSSLGERPFATRNNTIQHMSLYGNHLRRLPNTVWNDLGTNCYVAIDNLLQFAPVTRRTDLKIELVNDEFALPIKVPKYVANILRTSGFDCKRVNSIIFAYWNCTPCPQGKFGRSWTDSGCMDCPPGGFYQNMTGQVADDEAQGLNCQNCNNGTYVTPAAHPGTGPADCTVCPTGTNKNLHAGFRACPCLHNYYRKDRFGVCYPCPVDGLNCSGEYQHLLPGFWWTWDWSSDYSSYQQFIQNVLTENARYDKRTQTFGGVLPKVHRCPRSESCVNDGDGINATCEEGYTGWLCAECSPDHYLSFDQCSKCPEWWKFLLEVIAVCIVLLVVIIIIAREVRKNRRTGRSAVSVLLARGKILLGFYQVVGEIFSALDEIPWPHILTSVGSFFKLLEVNIMQLFISPRCYFPDFTYPNIYIEFIVGFSFVAFVLLAALSVYHFIKCYLMLTKTSCTNLQAVLSQTKQRCYLFVVILLFVSYPSLSSVILTLLPSGCDLFYLDENETINATRLRSDYSIDCQLRQHIHFNHAAEAALFYVIGFPLVLFLLLWWSTRRRKKGTLDLRDIGAHARDVGNRRESVDQPLLDITGEDQLSASLFSPSTVSNDDTTTPYPTEEELLLHREPSKQSEFTWDSFLSENYKPEFWFWEIIELARKIIQTLFILLYGPDDHFTLFATIVISVGFLVIHAYVRPMKDAAEHRLQMCSLGTIFLNLLAASLLLSPTEHGQSSKDRKEVLAIILVLLNLSIIVFVAASSIWTGVKALWRHGCCSRMAACILVVCDWCFRQRRSAKTNNLHEEDGQHSSLTVDGEYTQRPYALIIEEQHGRPSIT